MLRRHLCEDLGAGRRGGGGSGLQELRAGSVSEQPDTPGVV